ncbi:hypothetical protein FALBO_16814 [Fusarium albosuccineum]|uniref:Uncharacterized protein n=1 Tax=Fusarium albosuccineum TaxID=1237068 RepID=A0A8H4KDB9_9HYPO|nr:hypothetical protein FALBO_16814 [Fusarium albosuccineum]
MDTAINTTSDPMRPADPYQGRTTLAYEPTLALYLSSSSIQATALGEEQVHKPHHIASQSLESATRERALPPPPSALRKALPIDQLVTKSTSTEHDHTLS